MTLSPGRRLGPYEILSSLGAGGMGEVYRARDIRLDRQVAIKVLPGELSSDPHRLRRFEQEARAASALNHPNIITIHDVGLSDSISYIAMEYVEGKTLSELLKGPLPVKKLLDLAVQLADGLAAAHAAGIVHRDLKPSNVMVSKDGFVKILDFGLAQGVAPRSEPAPADPEASTKPAPGTTPGAIVGTVSFMSPEQASGHRVDARSDQFSFGAILYEMATGRRAFRGRTDVDVLSAILHEDPEPASEINPKIPPPLRWITERCLAKEPQDRFASTADLCHDLASIRDHLGELSGSTGAETIRSAGWRRARRFSLPALVIGLALLGVLAFVFFRRSVSPGRSMRFSVFPPENTAFNFYSAAPAPAALNRDGTELTFAARDSTGKSILWVRALDSLSARPLNGTEGATYPFWSADGRFVGFFADGKLKKIPAGGGAAQTLCNAPDGRGGSWSRSGVILFAPQGRGPLYRISDTGGAPTPATRLFGSPREVTHRWPSFLPDGRNFLYLARDLSFSPKQQNGVWIGTLDQPQSRFLVKDISNASYASGHVLLIREGSLVAIPVDETRLQITGPAITLVDEVQYHPYRWNGIFSASDSGVLLFQPGRFLDPSRLEWFDRAGKELARVTSPRELAGLRLAPDGRSCAVEVQDSRSETIDIWIADLTRDLMVPLTHGGGLNDSPTWAPDGKRIVFASNRGGRWRLYEADPQAGAETVLLDDAYGLAPSDWSPDGHLLLLNARNETTEGKSEIWTLTIPERKVSRLLRGPFNQRDGRLSPDGEWIAYCSDESGVQEIYIRHLGDPRGKTRISGGGGSQPVWRQDGQELFYLGPDSRIMAAPFHRGPKLELGEVAALFPVRTRSSASDISVFDVSADGQRFLVNTGLERQPSATALTLVLNWLLDLKR